MVEKVFGGEETGWSEARKATREASKMRVRTKLVGTQHPTDNKEITVFYGKMEGVPLRLLSEYSKNALE